MSSASPSAVTNPPKDHRLDDDPRDEEVRVVLEAGRGDGAAEDVGEQQHEHDRLDGEADEEVRLAADPEDASFGEHGRVGGGVSEGRHRRPASSGSRSPGASSSASATRPVSVRKTSSSVGRLTPTSAMPTWTPTVGALMPSTIYDVIVSATDA